MNKAVIIFAVLASLAIPARAQELPKGGYIPATHKVKLKKCVELFDAGFCDWYGEKKITGSKCEHGWQIHDYDSNGKLRCEIDHKIVKPKQIVNIGINVSDDCKSGFTKLIEHGETLDGLPLVRVMCLPDDSEELKKLKNQNSAESDHIAEKRPDAISLSPLRFNSGN